MLNRSIATAMVLGMAVIGLANLHAAPPQDAPAFSGGNQNMVTQFTGKLKGFQRGVLLVTRDDGTEVMVQPPDDPTSFVFQATAKPAFLQRGVLVRFTGSFNPAGVPMAPVPRVEVFQPVAGKLSGHAREKFVPGVYGDQANRNQPPQPVANYSVVGALMGLDASGVMVVQAGNRPVQVQLTPDAKFELKFNNLSLAQEGDPVTVAGFYQPPDDTKVKADRVTITTDRVYGEPGDEPPRRSTRRRRGREEASPPAAEASAETDGQPAAEAESAPAEEQE